MARNARGEVHGSNARGAVHGSNARGAVHEGVQRGWGAEGDDITVLVRVSNKVGKRAAMPRDGGAENVVTLRGVDGRLVQVVESSGVLASDGFVTEGREDVASVETERSAVAGGEGREVLAGHLGGKLEGAVGGRFRRI